MSRAAALGVVGIALVCGCGSLKQITTSNGDLADYRAFRVAEHQGTRLARAQAYLEKHPDGAWAAEVKAAFDAEEPAYYEEAKTSRAKAVAYLTDLPRGPHAEAAAALLNAFDQAEAESRDKARRTEAAYAQAGAARRKVGYTVRTWLTAILEEGVYRSKADDPPETLKRVLDEAGRPTLGDTGDSAIGAEAPIRRREELPFKVPTREGPLDRVAVVDLVLVLHHGMITEARVEGPDLFARLTEADTLRPVDSNTPQGRSAATSHTVDVLMSILEARVPAATCSAPAEGAAILVRRCNGWTVTAQLAGGPGQRDSIIVRGPAS